MLKNKIHNTLALLCGLAIIVTACDTINQNTVVSETKEKCDPLCFTSPDRTEPVSFLIVHHFTSSVADVIKSFNEYKFSTHYIIDTKGNITSIVPEDKIAWHAGLSFWHGTTSLNRISIGIELQHPDYGQTPFAEEQIKSFVKLTKEILKRHNIPPENIIGHSDIAPDAKPDPGKCFPWGNMAKQGIGLWFDIKNAPKMKKYSVPELLSIIGYPINGDYGNYLVSSAYAFRRHFLPEQVEYEKDMIERGNAIFNARLKASALPPEQRAAVLENIPKIHPPDDGTFLTNEKFIETLRAVAYSYQQARMNKNAKQPQS